MRRSWAFTVAAIVAVLAVAGGVTAVIVGGGDDLADAPAVPQPTQAGDPETYRAQAEAAANEFKKNAEDASERVSSAEDEAGRLAGLDALKASVSQAADDFERLNPPAAAKQYNDELVIELRALATHLDQVKDAVGTDDQSKAQRLLVKLQKDQERIQSTLDLLEQSAGIRPP